MFSSKRAPSRSGNRESGGGSSHARASTDDAGKAAGLPERLQPLTEDLNELASDLRCSRRHIEAMDLDGRLGPLAIRLGRRRVWVRAEIQAWLAAGAPDRIAWLAIRGVQP